MIEKFPLRGEYTGAPGDPTRPVGGQRRTYKGHSRAGNLLVFSLPLNAYEQLPSYKHINLLHYTISI